MEIIEMISKQILLLNPMRTEDQNQLEYFFEGDLLQNIIDISF